jgi:hypothetical protein
MSNASSTKQFRGIAIRYDKLRATFFAFILACRSADSGSIDSHPCTRNARRHQHDQALLRWFVASVIALSTLPVHELTATTRRGRLSSIRCLALDRVWPAGYRTLGIGLS